MGGLFSAPEEPPRQSTSYARSSSYTPAAHQNYERQQYLLQQREEERRLQERRRYQEQVRRQLEEERIRKERERQWQQKIIPVSRRPLSRTVFQQPLTRNWTPMNTDKSFMKVPVDVEQNTQEYNEVLRMFKKTTQKRFKVVCIERIQNPYLLGCYLLKKSEMESLRSNPVKEMRLFHGTKQSNVQGICDNNFNWRLHGESKGNIFGQGVSFSPISYYASHYSDKNATVKVMFLVRVLVSNPCIGNRNMTIPPIMKDWCGFNTTLRCDTSQKENGHVYVKFSDNEFYPEYLIHFTVDPVDKVNKARTHVITKGLQRNQFDYDDYDDDYF